MHRYGLDASPLLGNRTGIGRLVEELVAGVAPRLRDDEELLLTARTFRLNPLFGVTHAPLRLARRLPRVRVRRLWLPTTVLAALDRVAPVDLWTGRVDLFHGANYALPALRSAKGIVTIHDLAVMRFPEQVSPSFAAWFRTTVTEAAPRADRVIADSEFTANDVVEMLGVPREKVTVVYPGVGAAYLAPGDRAADAGRLAERYAIVSPYVLFVGTTNPRKNLLRLLEAFSVVRSRADLPHRFVLVGDRGFGHGDVRAAIERMRLEDHVVLPGYVPEEDMPALYRAADAFAFPSLFEGFGLPVIEAMAAGCPVLASTASCLPEIAGEAAVLVEPTSVDDIAAGLLRILESASLRAELAAAGRQRAAQFTWTRFVDRHLDLYRELSGN